MGPFLFGSMAWRSSGETRKRSKGKSANRVVRRRIHRHRPHRSGRNAAPVRVARCSASIAASRSSPGTGRRTRPTRSARWCCRAVARLVPIRPASTRGWPKGASIPTGSRASRSARSTRPLSPAILPRPAWRNCARSGNTSVPSRGCPGCRWRCLATPRRHGPSRCESGSTASTPRVRSWRDNAASSRRAR